ncbi:MAG: 1-acyl-sn-glycerol-3-phosphate acyltransferase [Deltaproteobacteria bacterium]|nr:1-acyl-sn-glycerol-3-phosphate acyltransferase [Deltaproteobacteria bacterium]
MILGIVRLIVFVVDTAVWILFILVASLLDREARIAFRVAQWWAWANLKLTGTCVAVDGLAQLDPRRSYVFVSNHRSNLDVLALVVALWNFQLRWVAKEELFRIPLFGWAMRAMKQIMVNRANHAQAIASLATAKQRMHDGISVVFFPEGTRSEGAEMLPFKKGGFVFALETGVTVVPIAITGTASILPRTGWIVRRGGDVRVSICRPITTATRTRDDRDALLAEVRNAIAARLAGGDVTPPIVPARVPVSAPPGMRSPGLY